MTYGYDALNRIDSASSQATSGNDCWGQTIPSSGYDRFGNLSLMDSTKCGTPTLNLTVRATTNRITAINGSTAGIAFDAAGDLTSDGL